MQVENGSRSSAATAVVPGNAESVGFAAGREVSGEFRCAECGYGVIVRSMLPACPMCRGLVWEEAAGSPFSF
jgi:rubrerythrin